MKKDQRITDWRSINLEGLSNAQKLAFQSVQEAIENDPNRSIQSIAKQYSMSDANYYEALKRLGLSKPKPTKYKTKVKHAPVEAAGYLEMPIAKPSPVSSEAKDTLKVIVITGNYHDVSLLLQDIQR